MQGFDWQMAEINGKWVLSKVTLREIFYDRDSHWSPYEYRSRFRVLVLEHDEEEDKYVYVQYVYLDDDSATNQIPDIDQPPQEVVIPTVRGEPLDYIPFKIIGPFTNTPDVQRPPILDIVTLNYSHYMSYAQLEQALRTLEEGIDLYETLGAVGDGLGPRILRFPIARDRLDLDVSIQRDARHADQSSTPLCIVGPGGCDVMIATSASSIWSQRAATTSLAASCRARLMKTR